MTTRPEATEYAPYYGKYMQLVPEADILEALRSEIARSVAFLREIPEGEAGRCHPPYTWTIRQVIGHLIDAERIFGYRALRFARGDATPLPGFDENVYGVTGEFDRLPIADLAAEYEAVRRSHVLLFGHLPEAAWTRRGVANEAEFSVRALAWILVGHERHHLTIVRRRLAPA
jgi:hypothetical protein